MPEQVWEYFPHLDPANPDDARPFDASEDA